MISVFCFVCGAGLLFFVAFFVASSTPGRTQPKVPIVRKLPQIEAVDFSAERRFLVHLEKEISEFAI